MDQGNSINDKPCSCLTFAEAMAMDPSEVEVSGKIADAASWRPLSERLHWDVRGLRKSAFRRARPQRSRVQEMAERFYADTPAGALLADYAASAMKETIRAVCEYIRTETIGLGVTWPAFVASIEREFLEPR